MPQFKSKNVINHEVNRYLEHIIRKKLFANGYIFYGTEGVGKKETALKFIKEVFKQNSSSENIEEKISSNNHPDFLLVEPSPSSQIKVLKNSISELPKKSNTKIIKVDQIRDVKNFLSKRSIESDKKIVLITEAHLLNEAASNCLLKTLEEPNNGIFILLTSSLNLLLDTITSRCQVIRFKSFSCEQIINICETNLEISKSEINKRINLNDLVNSANGSPGKILKILEVLNDLSDEIKNILYIPLKDNLQILQVSKLITENLELEKQIILIQLIQQLWWRKTRNIQIIQQLENLKKNIKNYNQPRLAWEVSLLKISLDF